MRALYFSLLLLPGFMLVAADAHSQRQESSISIGPSVGIPATFRGSWGTGASVRGYIGTTRRGAVLLNSNVIFYPYFYKGRTRAVSMLKAGYKTRFLHPNLFLYADAGLAVSYGYGYNGSDPAAGVGVGYSLPVGAHKYIDIVPGWNLLLHNVPFHWMVNTSKLELHFAYRFALK